MTSGDALRDWSEQFVGGALCLDFINTIEYRSSYVARDRFTDYAAVLDWCEARESLPARTIARLARLAVRDRHGASRAWRDCVALREELRELLERIRAGGPSGVAVARLNRRISEMGPLPTLSATGGQSRFRFDLPGKDLDEPRRPIIWSAAALLVSEHLGRLGYCHAVPCRYVFLDLSRNHSRLWCADSCGNRVRVQRHQRRVQDGAQGREPLGHRRSVKE
jgi:predicted RNA-binding Zn ribbon-like protein